MSPIARLLALLFVLLPCVSCARSGRAAASPPGAEVATAARPAIWAGARGGDYDVGVTRTQAQGMDVTVWYPATAGGRSARLSDFSRELTPLIQSLVEAGLSGAAARAFVDSGLHARWEAPRTVGTFPLVLVSQGNQQDVFDQAVLAEIVASHGFVVASIPSAAIASPMKTADDVGPLAQRQAEELSAVAARIASLGLAGVSRMAVIGHSFGARAALLLAMHDTRVVALVSLDGGIGTATAQEGFAQMPWFSRERGTTAILHCYETAESFMTPDFTLLRSLPSLGLTLREMAGLRHAHFTTIGFQAAVDPAMRAVTRMGPEGPSSVSAMVSEVVLFLQATVR